MPRFSGTEQKAYLPLLVRSACKPHKPDRHMRQGGRTVRCARLCMRVPKVGSSLQTGVSKFRRLRMTVNGCCCRQGYRGQNLGPWDPWQASDV